MWSNSAVRPDFGRFRGKFGRTTTSVETSPKMVVEPTCTSADREHNLAMHGPNADEPSPISVEPAASLAEDGPRIWSNPQHLRSNPTKRGWSTPLVEPKSKLAEPAAKLAETSPKLVEPSPMAADSESGLTGRTLGGTKPRIGRARCPISAELWSNRARFGQKRPRFCRTGATDPLVPHARPPQHRHSSSSSSSLPVVVAGRRRQSSSPVVGGQS